MQTYLPFSSEKDIINIIDSVVLQEQDSMKQSRLTFAKEYIKINYPNVAQMCVRELKSFLQEYRE